MFYNADVLKIHKFFMKQKVNVNSSGRKMCKDTEFN